MSVRLEEKCLLARMRSKADCRLMHTRLTDKGHALTDRLTQAAIASLNDRLRAMLGPGSRAHRVKPNGSKPAATG